MSRDTLVSQASKAFSSDLDIFDRLMLVLAGGLLVVGGLVMLLN